MAAMWVPRWSRSLAAALVAALGDDLAEVGERPLVFFCFSGAAKGVYAPLLAALAGGAGALPRRHAARAAALRRCAVGAIFDSSPVPFDSEMGRRLLSPGYGAPPDGGSASGDAGGAAGALRAAAAGAAAASVDVAAGVLDFCLLEQWDRDDAAMW